MFESIKVAFAKNRAIANVIERGLLKKSQGDLMMSIAGSPENIQYATACLRTKPTEGKYGAVAGLFAKIAVNYENVSMDNGLNDEMWKDVCLHAIGLAVEDAEKAVDIFDWLIDRHRKAYAIHTGNTETQAKNV